MDVVAENISPIKRLVSICFVINQMLEFEIGILASRSDWSSARDCRSFFDDLANHGHHNNTPKGLLPFLSCPSIFPIHTMNCLMFWLTDLTSQVFDAITTSPKSLQTLLQCLLPTPPKSSFVTIRLSKEGLKLVVGGLRFAWQCISLLPISWFSGRSPPTFPL